MAGHAVPVATPGGVVTSVGPVYTPPARRAPRLRRGAHGRGSPSCCSAAARASCSTPTRRTRRATASTSGSATTPVDELVRTPLGAPSVRSDAARATASLASPMADRHRPMRTTTHWEALARFHGTGDDGYYDLDLLRAGGTLMGDEERAAHRRRDGRPRARRARRCCTCSATSGATRSRWRATGATVTAVDFSRTALDRLEALAEECGVTVATLEADATRAARRARRRSSTSSTPRSACCAGSTTSTRGWRASPARCGAGGALVLVELHPLVTMVESLDPLVVDFPYAFDGPHVYSGTGTYANRDADIEWTTVQYAHSIGEVVTAASRAGLALHAAPRAHLGVVQHRPVRRTRGRRPLPAAPRRRRHERRRARARVPDAGALHPRRARGAQGPPVGDDLPRRRTPGVQTSACGGEQVGAAQRRDRRAGRSRSAARRAA